MTFLPPTPKPRLNLASRLFVDPKTEAKLRWSLFHDVDPASQIDGKPLLQVFCEHHKHNSFIGSTHHFKTDPLPTRPGETWPDPRVRDPDDEGEGEWPNVDMWIAAHLICNGPDPFAWKSEDGRDILDFAVQFRNPLLLDQLLRMPGAPSVDQLQTRKAGKASGDKMEWLHALCENGASAQNLEVLLHHGWSVDRLGPKKRSALFFAIHADQVKVLLNAGADPLLIDKDRLSIWQAWGKRAFSPSNQNSRNGFYSETKLIAQLKLLDRACAKLDPAAVLPKVSDFLFEAVLKSKHSVYAKNASDIYGVEVPQWRKSENDNTWSLTGFMAHQSLKSRKSPATSCALALSAEGAASDLDHQSIPGISDLALLWLSVMSYGDEPNSTRPKMVRLMENFGQDHEDLKDAYQKVWRAATTLVGHAQPGTKFDDAVHTAWEREIDFVTRETYNALDNNDLEKTPRACAFLADPSIMIEMSRMPFSDTQWPFFNKLITALSGIEDGKYLDVCFHAAANISVNPQFQGNPQQLRTIGTLDFLIERAPHWAPNPGDDLTAWNKIDEKAKSDPKWGGISSWMSQNFLKANTGQTTQVRARARL